METYVENEIYRFVILFYVDVGMLRQRVTNTDCGAMPSIDRKPVHLILHDVEERPRTHTRVYLSQAQTHTYNTLKSHEKQGMLGDWMIQRRAGHSEGWGLKGWASQDMIDLRNESLSLDRSFHYLPWERFFRPCKSRFLDVAAACNE